MLNSDYEEKLTRKNYYLYFRENNVLAKYAHFHSNLEIIYLLEGSVSAVINGKESKYNKNDLIIVNSFEMHYYKKTRDNIDIMVLLIGYEYLNSFLYFCDGKVYDNKKSYDDIPISERTKIKDLLFGWNEKGISNSVLNAIYLNNILYILLNNYTLCDVKVEKIDIKSVLKYIQDHYNENISSDIVANHIGYTREYFSTEFNKYVGTNFRGYINEYRIWKVEELIKEKNIGITRAIKEAGFDSTITYYRAKKKLKC